MFIRFLCLSDPFLSDETELAECPFYSVFKSRRADEVAPLLEEIASVLHADAGPDGFDHFDVYVAVAETDSISHVKTQSIRHNAHGPAFIELAVDDLAEKL